MEIRKTKLKLKKRKREIETTKEPHKKVVVVNTLTKAEQEFKKRWDKNFEAEINGKIIKTHRERVEKFNKILTDLPEQFDIPKIGPG